MKRGIMPVCVAEFLGELRGSDEKRWRSGVKRKNGRTFREYLDEETVRLNSCKRNENQ